MKRFTFILITFVLVFLEAIADNFPLSAINFHEAYLDVPLVKNASENPGTLSEDAMAYLFDENNPLDVKLAIINAIGYDPDKRLSIIVDYQNYCASNLDKKKFNHPENQIVTRQDLLSYANPDQMAIFVYLTALADHFSIMPAYELAESAMQNPVSKQSFMLPMAFVWAQLKLDMGQWNEIYPTMEYLFLGAEQKDMRPEAVKIIMDYINKYKENSLQ